MMDRICVKNWQPIDVEGVAGQVVTQDGDFKSEARTRQKAMNSMGSGLKARLRVWGSSSRPEAEFEELALPLFDSLYNFAGWLVGNKGDAEDLVQETYLKALRGFASFQPGTNFRAWIFRILKNTFLSSCSTLERRRSDALLSDQKIAPNVGPAIDTTTPETVLMNRRNSQLVQRAICDLPVRYRDTLLLCDVEEMSYQEIADSLSIPIGTVMSRLSRARKAIRDSLLDVSGRRRSSHPGEKHDSSGTLRAIGTGRIDQD